RGDARIHDHAVGDLPQAHGDEVGKADVGTGQPGPQPNAEEGNNDAEDDESGDGDDNDDDGGEIRHDGESQLGCWRVTMRRKLSAPMISRREPTGAWPDWQKAS